MHRLLKLVAGAAIVLGLAILAPAPAPAAPPNLVSLWHFDEDADECGTAVDDVGINDGAVTGAVSSDFGAFGRALDFDGPGDRVVVADDSSLQTTGSFTYEAWVNVDTLPGFWAVIMAKWQATGFGTAGIFFTLQRDRLFARLSTNGSNFFDVIGSTSVTPATWHHVAVVLDTATTTVTVYLHGNPDGSTTNAALTSVYANNGIPVTIGSYNPVGFWTDTIDGRIDEARIWNSALTPARSPPVTPCAA